MGTHHENTISNISVFILLAISSLSYAGAGDFLITIFNATNTRLIYHVGTMSSGFISPMGYQTIESGLQRPPQLVDIFDEHQNSPFYHERVPTHHALVVTGEPGHFKVWNNVIPTMPA